MNGFEAMLLILEGTIKMPPQKYEKKTKKWQDMSKIPGNFPPKI